MFTDIYFYSPAMIGFFYKGEEHVVSMSKARLATASDPEEPAQFHFITPPPKSQDDEDKIKSFVERTLNGLDKSSFI